MKCPECLKRSLRKFSNYSVFYCTYCCTIVGIDGQPLAHRDDPDYLISFRDKEVYLVLGRDVNMSNKESKEWMPRGA